MTEGPGIVQQLEEEAPEQHRLRIEASIPGGRDTINRAADFEGFQELESNLHSYNRQLEGIRNNPDLSDDERWSLAAEARTKAIEAQEQSAQALAAAVAEESRKLERSLFAGPFSGSALVPSEQAAVAASQQNYRQALGTVAGQGPEELSDTLAQANLTGDETLARAVLTAAHRQGAMEVVNRYADGRSEEAGRYTALTRLPNEQALGALASGYRPPEIQRVEELQTPRHVRERMEQEKRSRETAALREQQLGSPGSAGVRKF